MCLDVYMWLPFLTPVFFVYLQLCAKTKDEIVLHMSTFVVKCITTCRCTAEKLVVIVLVIFFS